MESRLSQVLIHNLAKSGLQQSNEAEAHFLRKRGTFHVRPTTYDDFVVAADWQHVLLGSENGSSGLFTTYTTAAKTTLYWVVCG